MTSDDVPEIAASSLVEVVKALESLGVDGDRLLENAGMSRHLLREASAWVSQGAIRRLWDLAEALTDDPHVGLSVAARMLPGALGAFEYMLLNTPTLREVVQRAEKFVRVADRRARIGLKDDGIRCSLRLWREGAAWSRHDVEVLLAVIVKVAYRRHPARGGERIGVAFAHAFVPPMERYLDAFGVSPEFDRPYCGLQFPSDWLDMELEAVDANLGRILETYVAQLREALPQDDLTESIRHALRELLPAGGASLDAVAQKLHMSSRTLRRRLQDKRTSFSEILEALRFELACRLVGETKLPLKQVAAHLGYADQAAFHRAFKSRFDVTPAQFRKNPQTFAKAREP